VIDYKKISIFLFGFLLIVLSSKAQIDSSIYNSGPKHLKKAAKKTQAMGDHYATITYLEKFNELKPNKEDQLMDLAHAYKSSRNYAKAEIYFQQVVSLQKNNAVLATYYLATMQIYNGKYKEAESNLNKFKKDYQEKDKDEYKKLVTALLATCKAAPKILQDTLNFMINHVDTSINKAHVEFSPMPYGKDAFIFASLRSDTLIYYNTEDTTKFKVVRKFYKARKNGRNWSYNGEFDGPFNDMLSDNGNGTFGLDTNVFYFTRCMKKEGENKKTCAIYKTFKEDGKWKNPFELPEPINVKGFNTTQPTVGTNTKGEEVLYFISDREGGKGGMDLWFAEYNYKKKEFKDPKNAGKNINTPFDEFTPFFDRNSLTLFFSSEGWPGLGGLDIFETQGSLSKWSEPKNIGNPINSSVDDFYYVTFEDNAEGLFVSNREGGVSLKNATCCDDIYHFKERSKIYLAVKGVVTELLKADEHADINRDTTVNVPGVEIALYLKTDTAEPTLIRTIVTDKEGKYFLPLKKDRNYILKLTDSTHYAASRELSTFKYEDSDTLKNDFSLTSLTNKPIVIPNIYYEFDGYDLLPESKKTMDTTLLVIMKENPSIIIEIGSHTDGKGAKAYNLTLSQKRAESAVNYLISKGIDKKRLNAKGYGKDFPIAPNENADGSDNPEGRQKNRRTEFRVVGKIPGVSEIIYTE
jgi:OOP family OmpA-OmpF porin